MSQSKSVLKEGQKVNILMLIKKQILMLLSIEAPKKSHYHPIVESTLVGKVSTA